MPEARITLLGRTLELPCAAGEERRIADLAAVLDARLAALAQSGDPDGVRRLASVALALLAENQAAGAALARAHNEIDRLNDLNVDRVAVSWRGERLSARR
jgi:cell division protein ZapA (FtsZ GTPase activity inhibitor)